MTNEKISHMKTSAYNNYHRCDKIMYLCDLPKVALLFNIYWTVDSIPLVYVKMYLMYLFSAEILTVAIFHDI